MLRTILLYTIGIPLIFLSALLMALDDTDVENGDMQ